MTTPTPSKELILAEFKRLQDALPAGKTLTREQFRKGSTVSTSHVELHFGTFAELKRAAGAAPTRADTKLFNAVAKAATIGKRDDLIKERDEYGEQYLRTDESRYKTMLVITDMHDKEMDPFTLRVFLDTAKRVQPETIVLGGDVFDLPEFGRYNVDPREWDAVGRIKYTHANIFKPLREAAPDAQIDLIEGNHECVSEDTEVLTDQGWIRADVIQRAYAEAAGYPVKWEALPKIAQYGGVRSDSKSTQVTYNHAVATGRQLGREILTLDSLFKYEKVTANHSLVTAWYERRQVQDLIDNKSLSGEYLLLAIDNEQPTQDLELDPSIVRLAVWVMTTASVMHGDDSDSPYLLFNKPNRRVERRVKGVVQGIQGINWEKDGANLVVRGPALKGLLEVITGLDNIGHNTRWTDTPDWLERLNKSYAKIITEELTRASTQGFMASHTSYYNGFNHATGEALQMFLVMREVPCTLKKLPRGQYILIFNDNGKPEWGRGRKVKIARKERGAVISIQTHEGTLITRMEGRINFTGNCRLVKHLADFSPATRAILGDLHGMTIGDLFGLKDFQINYVAKADLKAYSAKEHDKELENNYRIYYDNVLVHHFPHARSFGLPGINGHHHRHQVWPMWNVHQGAYEWHQLGAGHKRSASYCEGERWHNGFALIHVDTITRSVNIEYIPVTNMAVVGGKFYTREPSEMIT